jgi:ABC-type branched-subunit amino acid transport system ATPase component/MFS family permease
VAEDLAERIERARDRARATARAAVGVVDATEAPPLREAIASSGAGWYPLIALSILVAVDQFQSYGYFVLGPEISATLGISRPTLAALNALKLILVSLASLPLAAAVQRRARRGLVAIASAVAWSVMTILTGVATSVAGLAVVLIMDGASTGAVEAVHRPLLVDSYPPETRVRAVSFYRGANAAGNFAAPLIVGLLVALGFTWRGVFVVMGLLCLGATAAASRLRDPGYGRWDTERVRAAVRPREDRREDDAVSLGFFESVRRVLLIRTVRRLLIANGVLGMFLVPLHSYLFFFFAERWGMGPGARSLLFAFLPMFAAPALLWFGRRGEALFRKDPARLVRASGAVLAVGTASVAIAVAMPVFAGMVLFFGIAFGAFSIMFPSLNVAMLAVVAPRTRPHTSALTGIFHAAVGGFGGLILLGGADRRFGTTVAIASLAIPGLVAAWIVRGAAGTVNDDLDQLLDAIIEDEELAALRDAGEHVPMLACRHIDFAYEQFQVLFDVSFTVQDGEIVALLGTNGAGKSTLLRVISGLGLPARGTVRFGGVDVTYLDAERRLRLGVAHIAGGRSVCGPLSVVENLRLYGYTMRSDRRAVESGLDASFEAFPALAERRNQAASTLSGGEQQMLALSKAFMLQPRLLLIDELSLGLAPKVVSQLLGMVRRINEAGTAIVLVEQSVNVALSLVQHAYFMERGEIRFDGRAAELLERGDLLRSVFLEGAAKGFSA